MSASFEPEIESDFEPIFHIPPGRHAAVIGMNGSGKSVLSFTLLANTARDFPDQDLIIIDPKREFEYVERAKMRVYDRLPSKGIRSWCYRPKNDDYDNTDKYDEVIRRAFDQKNTTVYIDDLAGLMGKTRKPPVSLFRAYQLGRSLGVSIVSSIQRPVWVPLEVLSESSLFYSFYLGHPSDRAKMADFLVAGFEHGGGFYDVGNLREFEFWAYDSKRRAAERCKIDR